VRAPGAPRGRRLTSTGRRRLDQELVAGSGRQSAAGRALIARGPSWCRARRPQPSRSSRRRARAGRRPRPTLRQPGRGEARRRAPPVHRRRDRGPGARRRGLTAGSPTACSSGVRPRWWPSTWPGPAPRPDPVGRRVRNLERTDIRSLTPAEAGTEPFDVVTADLSFISLTRALPVLAGPMVRAGPTWCSWPSRSSRPVGRGVRGRGVIRDPEVHRRTLLEVGHATVPRERPSWGSCRRHHRTGRERRVPAARPGPRLAVDDDGLRTLVDAAVPKPTRPRVGTTVRPA